MPTPRAEEVLSDLGIYSWGQSNWPLISAVALVGLRVPTPRAEEVLSVHLGVPSPGSRRLHCTGSEAHLVHGHSGYAGLRDC